MVKCVVIADDLTGANATGVMLKKMDYDTSTIMNIENADLGNMADCECVTFTTDSRGLDADLAYHRVYNTTLMGKSENVLIYANRIDSTLRGNLGSETDAMLDALGDDRMAIVVPCAPASGRVTVGGYMMVNGVMLSKTEAALDPKTPIADSRVKELFKKQTKYRIASLEMEDLAKGEQYIAECIRKLYEQGIRILVFDSLVQEDIDLIGEAVIQSGIKFIAVDPGAFTATLARKLIIPREQHSNLKILSVVGSVNPVTKAQMEHFWLSQPVYNVFVKTARFLENKEAREEEIARCAALILENAADYGLLSVTGDGINPEFRLDFSRYAQKMGLTVDDISEIINNAIAEIAYRIFKENNSFGGIYTCGGDITAAVCRRFAAIGISLEDEVIPLAACGRFIDGAFPGKWIVTKGGMTGSQDAINVCISKLKAMLKI